MLDVLGRHVPAAEHRAGLLIGVVVPLEVTVGVGARRHQAFTAVQAEPLGARMLDMEETFKALCLHQFAQDLAFFMVRQADFLAPALDPFLNPGFFVGAHDVHELHPDGAAIGAVQDIQDFPQSGIFQPEDVVDINLFFDAFTNPFRVKMLGRLMENEEFTLSFSDFLNELDMNPKSVREHAVKLIDAGLLGAPKRGKYLLSEEAQAKFILGGLALPKLLRILEKHGW